jgi:hypothetical protein
LENPKSPIFCQSPEPSKENHHYQTAEADQVVVLDYRQIKLSA